MTHGIDYSSSANGLIAKWSGIGLLYTWAVNGPMHTLCWCEGFSYVSCFITNITSLLITCLYFTSNRLQEILWRHALRQVQKEKAIKYIDPREGVEISKLFNILDALQIYRLLRYHKELAW